MRNAAGFLIGLLFLAAVIMTAAAYSLASNFEAFRHGVVGLALGQIVLAVAAVVFLRNGLRWRLLLLLTLLAASSWMIGSVHEGPPAIPLLSLLGAALVASAWCAALRFRGWRVTGIGRRRRTRTPPDAHEPAGQFSLATILLATTILAIYLGMLRASGMTWATGLDFLLFCCTLVIPACLMVKATARPRHAWLPAAICGALSYLFLHLVNGNGLSPPIAEFACAALTAELLFVGCALLVLRVAGVRLALPRRQAPRAAPTARGLLAGRANSMRQVGART